MCVTRLNTCSFKSSNVLLLSNISIWKLAFNAKFVLFLQDYLAHIIDMRNLPIRPEQVCDLFGNIEIIYEFNRWVTPTNTYWTRSDY